jgi:hypothetical protein
MSATKVIESSGAARYSLGQTPEDVSDPWVPGGTHGPSEHGPSERAA